MFELIWGGKNMDWLKSKTTALIGGVVALIALQGYGFVSLRSALENRIGTIEHQMQEVRALSSSKVSQLTSDLNVVTNRMGVTIQELEHDLTMTAALKQKYDIVIQADDNRVEKKDRATNEPIQFLVGRDRLRYEFVVNYVDKDRIRGYVSTPKDKILSAEGPSFRRSQ